MQVSPRFRYRVSGPRAFAGREVGSQYEPDGVTPWSGNCDHFAAFVYGLPYSGYASAQAHFKDLQQRGMVHTDTNPPLGALVFFAISMPYGHVAFSYGNGNLISTPASKTQAVYKTTIAGFRNYEGWSWPYFRTG